MASIRPERLVIKWRATPARSGQKLKARGANEAERAKYRDGAQKVEASDDIVMVYLVELDQPSAATN